MQFNQLRLISWLINSMAVSYPRKENYVTMTIDQVTYLVFGIVLVLALIFDLGLLSKKQDHHYQTGIVANFSG